VYPEKHQTPELFNNIAASYDRLNAILSMGIDRWWRYQMRRHLPSRNNLKVLDLATGTGDVAVALQKSPKVSYIEGLDMSSSMIDYGRKKIAVLGLQNRIDLQVGDGVDIPREDAQYDVVTISFGIRNFPDPLRSLENCWRVLKPYGRLMVLEFSLPTFLPVRMIYLFYFRFILPFVGNKLSGHSSAYSYLNQSVESFPHGKDFEQLMHRAGFEDVRSRKLTFGIATLYIGERLPIRPIKVTTRV
jgi:demethylmenaquinone methyltransferase/2-methoxy-6-polyprenyl-1,4-benzoquinol methylase